MVGNLDSDCCMGNLVTSLDWSNAVAVAAWRTWTAVVANPRSPLNGTHRRYLEGDFPWKDQNSARMQTLQEREDVL